MLGSSWLVAQDSASEALRCVVVARSSADAAVGSRISSGHLSTGHSRSRFSTLVRSAWSGICTTGHMNTPAALHRPLSPL
eukprot:3511193-Alexandrium_andersonii.AAC.1